MSEGSAMSNGSANSLADAGERVKRAITSRRVGSDNARNTPSTDATEATIENSSAVHEHLGRYLNVRHEDRQPPTPSSAVRGGPENGRVNHDWRGGTCELRR